MGERKVLNKYYPPDFDESLMPRRRRAPDRQETVRTMLPVNIQCTSCGEFMGAGKKFNSKKEYAQEDYLSIKIFRFYIKCVMCSSEITFKTDPKNGDYTIERGARRNYQPWREVEQEEKEFHERVEQEEDGDAMKALENRQAESKREMEQMEALEELRAMSSRHAQKSTEELLEAHRVRYQSKIEQLELQDEQEIQSLFHSGAVVRRVNVEKNSTVGPAFVVPQIQPKTTSNNHNGTQLIARKKRRRTEKPASITPKALPPVSSNGCGLVAYNSSDSD